MNKTEADAVLWRKLFLEVDMAPRTRHISLFLTLEVLH